MSALRLSCCVLALACAGCSSCNGTPEGDGGVPCDPLIVRAHLDCESPDVLAAQQLMRSMSLDEKVQQMSGPPYNPNNMFDQEDNARLDIPGFLFLDGPRGARWYNSDYGTTVFPVAAARASTWDLALERKVGRVMAREVRSLGRHVLLAPTLNQVTHPRWGRAQESYGEDSFLLGEMGAAFVEGVQHDPAVADPSLPEQLPEDTYQVQACVKHLAANNIEDTRIYVNAVLDERTLREVYLPHFRRAVGAGASCVMTSYNRVNGSYNGYSKDLVRDILKDDWGFPGFVITDWFAKGQTLTSPVAGLDIEMPFSSGTFPSQFDSAYFYGNALSTAVKNGQVKESLIDEAVLRILYAKLHHGLLKHPVGWKPWLTKSDEAQALALQVAREGLVLLKNGPTRDLADDVLPLDRHAVTRVSVVGKFANSENMGDKGSSDAKVVDGSLVVTPFEGIAAVFEGDAATVNTFPEVAGHEAAIGAADVVVVVGAYFYADLARSSSGEEGEWKDRESLRLPQRDLDNIAAAVALKGSHPGLKVVVVLKSGGAVLVNDWVDGVDAVVMAWYDGMKEGTALAELLFGDLNPSGKLCQSVPTKESDLPPFLNAVTGDVAYDYFHGYRWLEKHGLAPQYPFGFGLSFTRYEYTNLRLENRSIAVDGTLQVSVDVKNAGPRAGDEVVQLYVGFGSTAVADGWGRPVKQLAAFTRLSLAPGETKTATLSVKAADLAYWDVSAHQWAVERMTYELFVGPSSDSNDLQMRTTTFDVQ